MATTGKVSPEQMQEFYDISRQAGLTPAWMGRGHDRKPSVEPFLWRWEQAVPLILKSGEMVTPDRDVERRVLRLTTPGRDHGTTHTISAALQLLLPGENAPAHRHTPTAIRWVLHGEGAYTTVEGDKCYMERGDLVLTPSWTWHDHNNEGQGPMIWLDGLDTPLVHNLEATFYEQYPEDQQPITGTGQSVQKYSSGTLRPAWEDYNAPTPRSGITSGSRPTMRCGSWPAPIAVLSTTWPWNSRTRPPAAPCCGPWPAGSN